MMINFSEIWNEWFYKMVHDADAPVLQAIECKMWQKREEICRNDNKPFIDEISKQDLAMAMLRARANICRWNWLNRVVAEPSLGVKTAELHPATLIISSQDPLIDIGDIGWLHHPTSFVYFPVVSKPKKIPTPGISSIWLRWSNTADSIGVKIRKHMDRPQSFIPIMAKCCGISEFSNYLFGIPSLKKKSNFLIGSFDNINFQENRSFSLSARIGLHQHVRLLKLLQDDYASRTATLTTVQPIDAFCTVIASGIWNCTTTKWVRQNDLFIEIKYKAVDALKTWRSIAHLPPCRSVFLHASSDETQPKSYELRDIFSFAHDSLQNNKKINNEILNDSQSCFADLFEDHPPQSSRDQSIQYLNSAKIQGIKKVCNFFQQSRFSERLQNDAKKILDCVESLNCNCQLNEFAAMIPSEDMTNFVKNNSNEIKSTTTEEKNNMNSWLIPLGALLDDFCKIIHQHS